MADSENQFSQQTNEAQPGANPGQGFVFNNDTTTPATAFSQKSGDSVEWIASEFIFHEKTPGWYGSLAGVSLVAGLVIYLLTRDFISAGVILFGALMIGIYAGRKPRQLAYQVDNRGLRVGQKAFSYDDFKAFSIVQEGAFSSMVFLPLKRFSPLTTIYYPPDQEEGIVAIVANFLPMEERSQDLIDKFMHKVGF